MSEDKKEEVQVEPLGYTMPLDNKPESVTLNEGKVWTKPEEADDVGVVVTNETNEEAEDVADEVEEPVAVEASEDVDDEGEGSGVTESQSEEHLESEEVADTDEAPSEDVQVAEGVDDVDGESTEEEPTQDEVDEFISDLISPDIETEDEPWEKYEEQIIPIKNKSLKRDDNSATRHVAAADGKGNKNDHRGMTIAGVGRQRAKTKTAEKLNNIKSKVGSRTGLHVLNPDKPIDGVPGNIQEPKGVRKR